MKGLYVSLASQSEQEYLRAESLRFKLVELTEAEEAAVAAQLTQWAFQRHVQWTWENLAYHHKEEGTHTSVVPITDMVMLGQPYSSDDIAGAYWIEGKELMGVLVRMESYSALGMGGSRATTCTAFKTDGEVIGKTTNHAGHCSTEVDEWTTTTYALRRV